MMYDTNLLSFYPETTINTYLQNLKERKTHLVEKLPGHSNPKSLRGMITKIEIALNKWENLSLSVFLVEKFVKGNQIRKDVVNYLLSRGYSFSYLDDPLTPEMSKKGDGWVKQVRIKINPGGFMLLIDPGAGQQLVYGNKFVNPNAIRLDLISPVEFLGKSLFDCLKGYVERLESIVSSKEQYDLHIKRCKQDIGMPV